MNRGSLRARGLLPLLALLLLVGAVVTIVIAIGSTRPSDGEPRPSALTEEVSTTGGLVVEHPGATPTSAESVPAPSSAAPAPSAPAGDPPAHPPGSDGVTSSSSPDPAPARGTDATGRPPPRWVPTPGTPWQWQLSGLIDLSIDVPIYDLDGFDTTASTVGELHARGRRVICYVSVGAWEDWRSDADEFPSSILGNPNGWPGERWLDIRRIDLLAPIIEARFDLCADKGFDAVEPDNIDGYVNETGFPLTAEDQLVYNRWLANIAHERGLSIALKNDVDQVGELVDVFDFAINEECARYGECGLLLPFVRAGKAVLHVEYDLSPAEFCPVTAPLGFSSMAKDRDLSAWRQPC